MDTNKRVVISGVTGQDGSLMIDYLLKNTNHKIYGIVRRISVKNETNIKHLIGNPRVEFVEGDIMDPVNMSNIIKDLQPDYFINLAANSFVGTSWNMPVQVFITNTLSVLYQLDAIRNHSPHTRYYHAGCHDTKTRVVTKDGIKKYTELKEGDLVYSINQKNRNLELKPITKIFEYNYCDNLIEFNNGSQCVTPNHKMFYQSKSGSILKKEAKDFIKMTQVSYPLNYPVIGKSLTEETSLEEFIPSQKRKGNKNYGKHIFKINTLDLMYLIGLYIGDGSCRIMKKKTKVTCLFEDRQRNSFGQYASNEKLKKNIDVEYQCPQIIFSIPKMDNNFEKVVNVLNRNSIKWSLRGKCNITFHQWGLIPYFSECGHMASKKHVPKWIFDLNSIYQEKVLEGIMDSDGRNSRQRISTCSKQLQNDIVVLSVNCGLQCSISERPSRISLFKDGRTIKGNFPEYSIHILKNRTGYHKGHFKLNKYNGKVWCFEIEDNHNFLVERNGRFTFSGNSSEELGDVVTVPQDETHPLRPRSPYGASKAAARHIVKVYRESYNLYAVAGILFNHECLFPNTPILFKKDDEVFLDYVRNLMPERKNIDKENNTLSKAFEDLKIWDGFNFVKLKCITRNKISNLEKENQKECCINTRNGVISATPNHSLFKNEKKIRINHLSEGDEINHVKFPPLKGHIDLTPDFVSLLGYLVGDGYVGENLLRFVNSDEEILSDFKEKVKRTFIGARCNISDNPSGFGGKGSKRIDVTGIGNYVVSMIRSMIYEEKTKHKRVPNEILNTHTANRKIFLDSYYICDGLKKDACKYQYKSIKTNSPLLAQGILLLIKDVSNQSFNVNIFEQNNKTYYQINFHSDKGDGKGNHFLKEPFTIKKIINKNKNKCFVYDIETESGFLSAGVGLIKVGNSIRRGEEFVTRKITKGIAKIHKALINSQPFEPIELGNIDAKRDWSDAEDFVDGIWKMLNQELDWERGEHGIRGTLLLPKEYILSSNETHTVREFVEIAFQTAGIDGHWEGKGTDEQYVLDNYISEIGDIKSQILVKINSKFYRPAEVNLLLGDSSKAREELGWKPKTSFRQLVEKMVRNDIVCS